MTEGATTSSADGFGFTAATAAVMAEMSASTHKLRAETTNRAMMVFNQVNIDLCNGSSVSGWDEEGGGGY